MSFFMPTPDIERWNLRNITVPLNSLLGSQDYWTATDLSFIIHGSQPNNKFKPTIPSAKEPIAFAVRIVAKDIVRTHN